MTLRSRTTDPDAFKAALGSFASSVNVITVRDEEGMVRGMTATAFCSVSTDPLLVLVCVNSSTQTHRQILNGGAFGVNVLSESAVEISEFCSRPGSDKSLPDQWLAPPIKFASAPALKGSIAFLDCEVYRQFPAGTHGVIVGKVCAIAIEDGLDGGTARPLLHYRGNYYGVATSRLVNLVAQ